MKKFKIDPNITDSISSNLIVDGIDRGDVYYLVYILSIQTWDFTQFDSKEKLICDGGSETIVCTIGNDSNGYFLRVSRKGTIDIKFSLN